MKILILLISLVKAQDEVIFLADHHSGECIVNKNHIYKILVTEGSNYKVEEYAKEDSYMFPDNFYKSLGVKTKKAPQLDALNSISCSIVDSL